MLDCFIMSHIEFFALYNMYVAQQQDLADSRMWATLSQLLHLKLHFRPGGLLCASCKHSSMCHLHVLQHCSVVGPFTIIFSSADHAFDSCHDQHFLTAASDTHTT